MRKDPVIVSAIGGQATGGGGPLLIVLILLLVIIVVIAGSQGFPLQTPTQTLLGRRSR